MINSLQKEDIAAKYEYKRKELVINSLEARFFSSEGAVFIYKKYGSININSISDSGEIERIDIYIGDSIGFAYAKYDMADLSDPRDYYFGDDKKMQIK